MTTSTRTSRRRRMLHDGSATSPTSSVEDNEATGPKVRYTPPDSSASFAVASRVLPSTPLAFGGLVAGMLAVTVALGWADDLGTGLTAAGVNGSTAPMLQLGQMLRLGQPGSLGAWWEAGLWLAVAGQCVLLFGMRRHRTDDLSSGYRWWLFAAAVATGLSVSSATQASTVVAGQLASITGFSPLAGDAFWWIVPGGLVTTAAAVGTLLEVRECQSATTLAAAAGAATAASVASSIGLVPAGLAAVSPWLSPDVLAPIAAMTAAVLVFASLLAYSKRIAREALGEVSPPAAKKTPVALAETTKISEETPTESTPTPAATRRSIINRQQNETEDSATVPSPAMKKSKREVTRPTLAEETQSSRWVSGGEDYQDDYDDEGPERRKLSKAERKRLRRDKERHAA